MSKFTSSLTWFKTILILSLTTLLTFSAYAQIPASYCDGDPSDWANFQSLYPVHGYKLDSANATGNTDDQFTQGSKDGSLISSWRWSFGSANAKGDITNAAAALVNGCILRFAADRTSDNGDASIGFWFFRDSVTRQSNGTFSGAHQNGDLLILSDFTTGGTIPTIKIYEWESGSLVALADSTNMCANVNHTTANVPAGFTYTAANGSKQYAPNLFYEGAIDLCALHLPTCFSYFLVETRNSQSITASLQDFAANTFNATPAAPQATITQPTCTTSTGTITVTSPTGSGYTYSIDGTNFQSSTTFNNVNPGAYTVTVKTASGCTSTAKDTVKSAPPAPDAPSTRIVQPTCTVGTGSIIVTAPKGTGYSYSLNNSTYQTDTVFAGLSPGNYTVFDKNSSGCIDSAHVTINAQPATPDRPVVTLQESTICNSVSSPTITVSCPVVGTYTLKQTGQTDQTFAYNGTNGPVVFTVKSGIGGFSITVTNSAGCTSAATNCSNYQTNSCPATIASKPSTLTTIEPAAPKVTAAPNPFNDVIRFTVESPVSGKGSLELYNMLGQKVKVVYQGYFEKGRPQTIQYNVPYALRSNLIFSFTVGDHRSTGKLIGLK